MADEVDDTAEDEPDVFPRAYVERLRAEAADYRTKTRDNGARADLLAGRLLAETVATVAAQTLLDPSDQLDFMNSSELVDDETGLPDLNLIEATAAQLVERKPHLARRRPTGSVEQGARTNDPAPADLASILRRAVL